MAVVDESRHMPRPWASRLYSVHACSGASELHRARRRGPRLGDGHQHQSPPDRHEKIAWGWEADRIHEEYPHLPLAKVHAAFQYYYDHKEQCDREIEETSRWIEEMRRKQPESPLRKRLRDRGILP